MLMELTKQIMFLQQLPRSIQEKICTCMKLLKKKAGQPIFLHLPFTTSHQRRVANQGRFFTRLLAKKTNVRNSR